MQHTMARTGGPRNCQEARVAQYHPLDFLGLPCTGHSSFLSVL